MRVLAWTIGAAAVSAIGLGGVIARRLTAPPSARRFDLTVRNVEQEDDGVLVVLDRTRQTTARGRYFLMFEASGWAQLSEEILDRGPDLVASRLTVTSPGLEPSRGDRASWSGIFFSTPAEAELSATDVRISTPAGMAPAWLIEGDGDSATTWAIHIHGMGSPRSGTLRGARLATELGYTSLIVSYRNDGEGPLIGSGRSMLGAAEADDVDAAVQFALDHGARRIVLFGWSMGAAIALQLVAGATRRSQVDALVLESPVLDWVATLKANCVRAGLPASAALLAVPWLTLAPLSRALGLQSPIPLRALDWIARAHELKTPTLVLHGTRDDSAPLSVARSFAGLLPDTVQLEEFDAAHTMTWNSDPDRWQTVVSSWLKAQLPLD
ncbi:alpha/beta fold hydrolase [uncultured Microbacterium sp.]|uniref:alpha/beta hydrolase family protein n=1 Tax=uncultured Microbacterium sp. TaxID=191216 RepID=UPI0028D5EF2D|nr:alpha/beta fold hydrolase [uncultured Microbacterium sp.]